MKYIVVIISIIFNSFILSSQDKEYIIHVLKGHNDNVNSAAFSFDDQYVYTGSDDLMIKQWDINSGELVREVEGDFRPIKYIKCLSDGVTIFSAAGKVVKAWNILLEKQDNMWSHPTFIWSFDLNPQNDRMICGSYEKKIYLWNLYTNELLGRLEAHEKNVLAVAFSKDGKYFASGSLDQHVFIWNAINLETEKVGIGHSENIYDVEFTPDSKYLISVSKDKMIKIWEVETGGHYKTLSGHTDAVMTISVHPEGRFFLTGSFDGTIRLWDITNGNNIYTFISHESPVNEVRISHNGNMFSSSSNDKTAIIWKFPYKIIAEYYFSDELQKKWESNALFKPKQKDESRNDYLLREDKANILKEEIYLKYFNMLVAN